VGASDTGHDASGEGGPFDGPVVLKLDGVLDLHAFDPRDLGALLPAWIDDSHAAGLRGLRVIHGKGTGALRRSVEALLARHPLVAAFRPAGEGAGGWGATLVELRDAPLERSAP
jgi:DNA-nicking Smr family endonuclease